jgi:hypothetical protein
MVLLDEFLDRGSPFIDLFAAGGVNEAGDIAGHGRWLDADMDADTRRAFLAIPQ